MRKKYTLSLMLLLSFPVLLTNLYAQQAGNLDTSFGTDGIVTTTIPDGSDGKYSVDIIYSMALQSDGKIVVAGASGTSSWNLYRSVARYDSDGSLDTSFGSAGSTLHGEKGTGNVFLATVVQPDEKIVAVGRYKNDFTVSRFNTDGSLDDSFGPGGIVNTEVVENNQNNAFAVALQSDGKIVVGGNTYNTYQVPYSMDFALVRYHPNGILDTTFGNGGKVVTDFYGEQDHLATVAIQPDGKIVAAGYGVNGTEKENFAIARYNTDGSLDAGFGTGGKVSTDFTSSNGERSHEEEINSLIILEDGKILVGGFTNMNNKKLTLARYNSNGSLDSSFGEDGIVQTTTITRTMIALQDDGKIVGTGFSSIPDHRKGFGVARFNDDGSSDPSFGDAGEIGTTVGDDGDQTHALVIQPDGKILVAGESTSRGRLGSITSFLLARYHGGENLGIATIDDAKSLVNISPNPSNGRFSIQTEAIISNVSITNMLGQKVENILFYSEGRNYTIDLNNEQSGLYFLTLTTENGILTKKIIVR